MINGLFQPKDGEDMNRSRYGIVRTKENRDIKDTKFAQPSLILLQVNSSK
jgi:hypothetical protein